MKRCSWAQVYPLIKHALPGSGGLPGPSHRAECCSTVGRKVLTFLELVCGGGGGAVNRQQPTRCNNQSSSKETKRVRARARARGSGLAAARCGPWAEPKGPRVVLASLSKVGGPKTIHSRSPENPGSERLSCFPEFPQLILHRTRPQMWAPWTPKLRTLSLKPSPPYIISLQIAQQSQNMEWMLNKPPVTEKK